MGPRYDCKGAEYQQAFARVSFLILGTIVVANFCLCSIVFLDSIAIFSNMLDLDLDLNLDGVAGAAVTSGAGSDKAATVLEPESRWTSTSSIESNTDKIWVRCLQKIMDSIDYSVLTWHPSTTQ